MKPSTYEKATASLHVRLRPSQKEKLVQQTSEKQLFLFTAFAPLLPAIVFIDGIGKNNDPA